MAQTVYSFRGATGAALLKYEDAMSLRLTKSFRFGSNIALIANTMLFIKKRSEQTSKEDGGLREGDGPKLWQPYLIEGAASCEGQVDLAGDSLM